jgi:hypothetical protein
VAGRKYRENHGLELKQVGEECVELLVKVVKAIAAFRRQTLVLGANKRDIEAQSLAGCETASGLLYDKFEGRALRGFAPIGFFDFVPLDLTESQFAHA